MRLVYRASGKEVHVGDTVQIYGQELMITHFDKPHKPDSEGRVSVAPHAAAPDSPSAEYYAGVIGAEWIEREDRAGQTWVVLDTHTLLVVCVGEAEARAEPARYIPVLNALGDKRYSSIIATYLRNRSSREKAPLVEQQDAFNRRDVVSPVLGAPFTGAAQPTDLYAGVAAEVTAAPAIKYAITITTELTAEDIADLIVTALEGGIGYWCGGFKVIEGFRSSTEEPWYSDPYFWRQPFKVEFHDGESSDKWGELTPEKLQAGLNACPLDVLSRIKSEDYDAGDADTLIQMALFGEIVFG